MTCPICQGIGLHNEQICDCIAKKAHADLPPEFKDLFSKIWKGEHGQEATDNATVKG